MFFLPIGVVEYLSDFQQILGSYGSFSGRLDQFERKLCGRKSLHVDCECPVLPKAW